jgi:hypothetical protein
MNFLPITLCPTGIPLAVSDSLQFERIMCVVMTREIDSAEIRRTR